MKMIGLETIRLHVGALRAVTLLLIFFTSVMAVGASEVIESTRTRVVIRGHPKTGKPYVSIVSADIAEPRNPLGKPDPWGRGGHAIRPDYRMFDPKMNKGEIPYEGPASGRKKIYIFAAALATLGAASGAAAAAAIPTATAAGSAGGAGIYAAGGAAVAAGTAGAVSYSTRPEPDRDDFTHIAETKIIKEKESS